MALVIVSAVSLCVSVSAPLHEAEAIFPANPKHNHGSSIVETPQGGLLACWFHGSGERKSDDVLIQGARKRPGAGAWSDPFLMADSYNLPDCNPVLFIDPREKLWLFWIAIQDNQWGSSLLKFRTAASYEDDGPPQWDWQDVIHCRPARIEELFPATLAKAEEKYSDLFKSSPEYQKMIEEVRKAAHDKLSQRLGWMTRLHPIMLSDRRMMLGLYSDVFNCSLAAFTEDWGQTWEFGEPILSVDLGNIQPSFVRATNGRIVAFMRDNGVPNRVRRAESADGGKTWGEVTATDIPNPGSSVECIRLRSGNWVLICNDTVSGRHRLTAYLSDDEGSAWKWKRALEDYPVEEASASYPSVLQTSDGLVHCTYSFSVKGVEGSTIKHAWFNEEWVKAGQ